MKTRTADALCTCACVSGERGGYNFKGQRYHFKFRGPIINQVDLASCFIRALRIQKHTMGYPIQLQAGRGLRCWVQANRGVKQLITCFYSGEEQCHCSAGNGPQSSLRAKSSHPPRGHFVKTSTLRTQRPTCASNHSKYEERSLCWRYHTNTPTGQPPRTIVSVRILHARLFNFPYMKTSLGQERHHV